MKTTDISINDSRKCNGVGTHDQIIHFINKEKRMIQGVVAIWENEMTHIVDYLGIEYIVNKDNVLFTERISRGGVGYGTDTGTSIRTNRSKRKKPIDSTGEHATDRKRGRPRSSSN